ncbi:MAG TPA: D-alanyl-D-alanine carboxypeptidase/D-alanyl-D-alanine-endopeptidase, partial [Ferruginibacter sp.]|nr:D-alanyl-D-alanine carboxypeptidase/D-alanyl-D-alanine-endopeptidase [Ferruginibacter sp.]
DGRIEEGVLQGNLHIVGSGDPTLGSWRWESTRESQVLQEWVNEIKRIGIKKVNGIIINDEKNWSTSTIPDGWIWQDIGNYYGAGAVSLNWHENQYDILLNPGVKEGDPSVIAEIIPSYTGLVFENESTTGPKNSGDNAYIYLPMGNTKGTIRGTIPLGERSFSISGAVPDPVLFFLKAVNNYLQSAGILQPAVVSRYPVTNPAEQHALTVYLSPALDSMNYWFLKRSINLYGEAFVKTISFEKNHFGSTDSGINIIKNFWMQHGIDKRELKIIDGSGLSPANRVTTAALVSILQYAKSRPWFNSFYNSLPEINGIKMKDGYINGVRSYAGFIKSKSGIEYTFSFMVNNFDGSAAKAREKMWALLDVLK